MAHDSNAGLILTGLGYDIHRLASGRPMVLGGVLIANAESGPVAHSDGDVLLHALCDALLGAVGLEDIGHHFPDTDPVYAGADSLELLRQVLELLEGVGARPVNVDCTLVLEAPKIAPYRATMRERIAGTLKLPVERVSIKATTNEKLGPVGKGEGVVAYAIATVMLT